MVQEQENGNYLILSSIAQDLREKGYNVRLSPVTKQEAYNPNLRSECNIRISTEYTIVLCVVNGRIECSTVLAPLGWRWRVQYTRGSFTTKHFDIFDPRSIDKLYLAIELFTKLIHHDKFVNDSTAGPVERIRRCERDLEVQADIMREYQRMES